MDSVPPEQLQRWAFIAQPIHVDVPLPYTLAPGLRLVGATPQRMEAVQHVLSRLDASVESLARVIFSKRAPAFENRSQTSCYHFLETDGDQFDFLYFHWASEGTDTPLDTSTLTGRGGSTNLRHGVLNWRVFDLAGKTPTVLGHGELDDLKESIERLWGVIGRTPRPASSIKYPEILRAHRVLMDLASLPPDSDFHVVGLFAIVEMLITHNPKGRDIGDSITHQMQSKVPLLVRRFVRPLSTDEFFGSVSSKKVWSALYAYRSAIAHGGSVDFSSGELRLLKDQITANKFLSAFVRRLIRHSYNEPDLYRDLREC